MCERARVEFLVEFFGGRRQDQQRLRKRKNPETLVIQGFPGGAARQIRTADLILTNYNKQLNMELLGYA
jgi:hypothetical protein